MTDITKIKELRDSTGISVGECKSALEESGGDLDAAMDVLRKRGVMGASRRSERICSEGLVTSYVHTGGRVGVLLQVNCESDFVARGDDFKQFMHEVCLQIASMRPLCVSRDDIPEEKVEKETRILMEQASELKKPINIQERMVKGQLEKWFAEICLLDQTWVKDPSRKIGDLLTDLIQKTGENVVIRRFARFEAGSA